jgi:hypothetical protein
MTVIENWCQLSDGKPYLPCGDYPQRISSNHDQMGEPNQTMDRRG